MNNFIGSALYTFNIPEPWFSLVFLGKKTIYGTLFSPGFRDIKTYLHKI